MNTVSPLTSSTHQQTELHHNRLDAISIADQCIMCYHHEST